MSDAPEVEKTNENVNTGPGWKDHAREWEKRAKENLEQLNAAKAELETLRTSGSEWEQKLADAKARADEDKALAAKTVRDSYVSRLARVQLEAQAAKSGVGLTDTFVDALNLSKFIDADAGEVNTEAVTAFVDSLAGQSPTFDQSFSNGPQTGSGPQVDYSPQAIAERVNKISPY